MNKTSNKSIVIYYSRAGMNYVSGDIINLKTGNTEVIANKIQTMTDSDVFHIQTLKSYPVDYTESTEVAKKEYQENFRPELTDKIENIEQYDTIFLGYPIWWNTYPMAVATFLDQYNLAGKTILPFCTHEGSGLANSVEDIKKSAPRAKVVGGLAIVGSKVNNADAQLENWINNNLKTNRR